MWCAKWDLNPHILRYRNLNPACLPISPLSLMFKTGCRRNRTFNLRIKSPMLCQLSYTPTSKFALAIHPVGFEPATLGFEVRCSIQLSYGCEGWVVGLEPTASGTTIPRSYQLSYTHHPSRFKPQRTRRLIRDQCTLVKLFFHQNAFFFIYPLSRRKI